MFRIANTIPATAAESGGTSRNPGIRGLRKLAAIAAVAMAATLPVQAATELIVPYGAGGFTDVMSRAFAEALAKVRQSPVIVVNKPGGGSVLGMRYAVDNGKVDGSTLLIGGPGYVTKQFQTEGNPFDASTLTPVMYLGGTPSVLYVSLATGATTLDEFVDWARQRPGGAAFGSTGVASSPHLNAEDLAVRKDFTVLHTPFQSNSAAVSALAGNHIDALFDASATRQLADTGKIRAIFVGSDDKLESWPELPNSAEAGVPGFRAGSWFGIFVPAGTSVEVLARVNQELNAALQDPDLQARLESMNLIAGGGSAADFERRLAEEKDTLGELIRTRNIHVE